ncbi:MAG: DNA-3-methyladenine glycosylase 2 family protein [Chitinophagaceae bacterium]|nr:DNA-3-methyladenine glycosylase 2 family protein [Chitinophagaceae bacterium]
MKILKFDKKNFHSLCDHIAERDADLQRIINVRGYPSYWVRPNSFQTLALTIIEQQISLAAAYAVFGRLKKQLSRITPTALREATDEELRGCGLSKQKIAYLRHLSTAVQEKQIRLRELERLPDEEVRRHLIRIKGIGNWTVDAYLIHALRRTDVFPLGDVALVNSLKEVKRLPSRTSLQRLLQIAEAWRPYRTIAAMILWHEYIRKREIIIKE